MISIKKWLYSLFRKKYGKTIVLGTYASGKTNLIHWLINNELPKEYLPTNFEKQIKEFIDSTGAEYNVKNWEESIKDKKNIFYLFNMEKFFKEDIYSEDNNHIKYNEIVIYQISLLTEHFREKTKNKKILIIGTHFDKLSSMQEAQTIITTIDKEVNLNNAKIIYGSLINGYKANNIENEIKEFLKG